MSLILRRTVFAFVLGAALTAAVFVGRAAHATTGEINACFKPSNGTLYLLGGGSGRSECQSGDIPISWNTAGLNGQDGVSVTSHSLAPGDDPACPSGGSKFTAANGDTYACNGSNGRDGQDGQDGQDGVGVTNLALAPGDDPACPNGGTKFVGASGVSYACNGSNGEDGQDGRNFSGTFTSPNGQYKLVVDDTTAKLESPLGRIQISGSGVEVSTQNSLTIRGGNALTLQSQGLFSASGAVTTIGGGQILLNGSSCGLLRASDIAPAVGPGGGPILLNPTGSPTIRFAC
jgi:hypothetical protein